MQRTTPILKGIQSFSPLNGPRRAKRTVPILAATILASCAPLFAGTVIKSATGTDLADPASWGGTAPTTADAATWNATSLVAGLTAATDVTWNAMVFGQAASTLTGPLDITGTGKINLSITNSAGSVNAIDMTNTGANNTVSIANDLVLGYSTSVTLTPGNTANRVQLGAGGTTALSLGNVTSNGGASANDTNVWLRGTSNNSVVGGTLTVDGQLAKGDTGVWTLSKANTIGWIFINNGGLRAATNTSFGAGTIYVGTGGGTVTLSSADTNARTYANALDLSISLSFGQGSGGTGAQTFTGPVNLNAAVRTLTTNQAVTLSGVISSGAGSGLTKAGTSTLTLSGTGANTYTGTTTVTAGTLTMAKTAGVNAVPGNVSISGTGLLTWTNADQLPDTASVSLSGDGQLNSKVIDTFASITSTGATAAGKVNFSSASNATLTGALSITGNNALMTANYNFFSLAGNTASSTLSVGSLSLDNAYYGIGQGGANNATMTLNGDYTGANTSTIAVGATGGVGLNRLSLPAGPHAFNVSGVTTINAAIIGAGNLTKQGTGTLVLNTTAGSGTGAVTNYSGLTTVSNGTLQIDSAQNGTGGISVTAGVLSGIGTVASAVTVGDDTGSQDSFITGGTLATIGTFTTLDLLTLKSDASYSFQFDSTGGVGLADKLVANGLTLGPTTVFNFSDIAASSTALTPSAVFTIIDNTSANPISGTFTGLPEGSVINVGVNSLQLSYAGGTGNDATLTVVPEPGAAFSLLGGLALLLGARRRR